MKNAFRRLLALLRQLFKDDRPKVGRGSHRHCIWRFPPPGKQSGDNALGDGDIDVIRIHRSDSRR